MTVSSGNMTSSENYAFLLRLLNVLLEIDPDHQTEFFIATAQAAKGLTDIIISQYP